MSFNINANNTLISAMSDLATQMKSLNSSHALIRAYYSKLAGEESGSSSTSSVNNVKAKNYISDRSNAKFKALTSDLKSAADKLVDTNEKTTLFRQNENGEYDTNAITTAVTSFVDKYNEVAKAVSESGNQAVQTQSKLMSNMADVFSARLGKVGITVNNDGTLSVDKDKLENADVDQLKSIFNGSNSYAKWVSDRTSSINTAAQTNDFNKTYSKTGIESLFNSNHTGSIFDYMT